MHSQTCSHCVSEPFPLVAKDTTSFDEANAHWQDVGHDTSLSVPLGAPPTEAVLSPQLTVGEGLEQSHRVGQRNTVDTCHVMVMWPLLQVMEDLRNEYARERAALEGQIKVRPSPANLPSPAVPPTALPLTPGTCTDGGHLGGREELPSAEGGRPCHRAGAGSRWQWHSQVAM